MTRPLLPLRRGPRVARSRSGPARTAVLLLLVGTAAVATPPQDPGPVLDRFDLSSGAGERVRLPTVLSEVSGLATSSDGRLFAHHDERGVIYQLDPETGEVVKAFSMGWLGLPGDFEGVAIAGEQFFLVTSNGELIEFREGSHQSSVEYRIHRTGLGRYCEMEGLAFDPETQALLLPCKNPRVSRYRDHLVVFSVPLASMTPEGRTRVSLPIEELDDRGLGDEFHPSAIEVHPETGSLLITAAREEALVELSPEGQVLSVKELKRKDHPQPEGLAFLPDGSLLIADEGQGERGRLTRYPLKAAGTGEHP